jgi:hypothetical protein
MLRVIVELPLVNGVAEELAHRGGPVALFDALDLFQVSWVSQRTSARSVSTSSRPAN